VTGFLLDEMYPTAAAEMLWHQYGHDAVHVSRWVGSGRPVTRMNKGASCSTST
jgi:hypothetical protein